MMRGARACAAAILLGPALLACGGGNDTPNPAPDPICAGPTSTRGAPIDGALEIGQGGPEDFQQSVDGDATEIVIGSQGGYMALPVFRVDATTLGTDGVCAYLKVMATVGSADPRNFDIKLPNSSPAEPFWFFGTLPLFLSSDESDLLGQTVTYDAAFRDDGKEADAQVTLTLVDNE